jgi:hypothetical protein
MLSSHDILEFKKEFGPESVISRTQMPNVDSFWTEVGAVIRPSATKDETVAHAWMLARNLASWILAHSNHLPDTEWYCVLVGWSSEVRRLQGQIVKKTGKIEVIQSIVAAPDWKQYEQNTHRKAIMPNWEKDVFEPK